jgi:transposase-like protein
VEIPYSEVELISWYKGITGAETIPSISMFLNRQRLSTQVPMHHKYYTDNPEMENINDALQHTTIVYTEQFYDIKTLQMVVRGTYYEE